MGSLPSARPAVNGGERPPDRRLAQRIRCQLLIEIRTPGSRFAIRGETTDVSITGCYVGSMQPLPVGTEIEFRCWVGARAIDFKAVIRTCDPCLGNGIEFLDVDDLSKSILGYHLQKLQAEDEDATEPAPVLRSCM